MFEVGALITAVSAVAFLWRLTMFMTDDRRQLTSRSAKILSSLMWLMLLGAVMTGSMPWQAVLVVAVVGLMVHASLNVKLKSQEIKKRMLLDRALLVRDTNSNTDAETRDKLLRDLEEAWKRPASTVAND